ncbi:discoidin domain-containing protein [Bathymodiolus thermophilus thioautotrophic gill symbiont]|uniref:Fucolectin tachylectin-4 pentraxin-1 domain-containing protein n=1 Tax=Bathymodiolus thermophilus thioautotrophic gill symbiont TaxID=2360 RepID=A0A8H9CFH3_9GAMM|nr:discoidin domain-containing protein [Bathymodiolus thermophilus thioautotrophic gill symbiont]CAB5498963.1 hypothetical protein THERMOS_942 [Bathymodiolus thermophilus thioautotrophic gill symbiont]
MTVFFRVLLISVTFVALSTHATTRFISGFVTSQAITIPDVDLAQNKNVVTRITGKLGGSSMGTKSPSFIATKLGENSFLAQVDAGQHKKGVFFKINSDSQIVATAARYCSLSECQNRNLSIDDERSTIASSQATPGYGIFDLTITLLGNLAFNKNTVQSSTYNDSPSSRAVDGNTDGIESNKSVSHTKKQKGAWWMVNLGGTKFIEQIRIFNRTDCCKNRLSNYRVSISDNSNFVVYQQDFKFYPNPKQIIDLGIQHVKGRYVKIQLLDTNFLSLAEVQVIGSSIYLTGFH